MALKRSNLIFGSPHQFTDVVDPRVKEDVSAVVGVNFMKNILSEAPVCTIIPGEPYYLPAIKDHSTTVNREAYTRKLASAYLEGKADGLFDNILDKTDTDEMRLYDFRANYTFYMQYVNNLCRTGAILLELGDVNLYGAPFKSYDWRNYRFTENKHEDDRLVGFAKLAKALSGIADTLTDNAHSLLEYMQGEAQSLFGEVGIFSSEAEEEGTWYNEYELQDAYEQIDDIMFGNNFIQFYVDADVSSSDSMSNATADSMIKSAFESGSNFMKEISFISNSGGINAMDDIGAFADSSAHALDEGITKLIGDGTSFVGEMGTALSRLINMTSNVIKGENIVFPEIYQSSSYSREFNITIHLRSPYGSKLAYYLNIFVPMMHLIALAIPKQATANSTASPFLVKAYVEGVFSCNLGIVSSLTITKNSDGWSTAGLPNEVDVTITIADLYSSLSISASPKLFTNNSSLIEFLATNCGLNLANQKDLGMKADLVVTGYKNLVPDWGHNVASMINESITETFLGFTKLTR